MHKHQSVTQPKCYLYQCSWYSTQQGRM